MAIGALFHVAIKAYDLDQSLRFYRGVLGLNEVQRPPLDFPGAWLAAPGHESAPLIHLYGGDAALEPDGGRAQGSGVVDHVSILASGFSDIRARLDGAGLPWRENVLPEAGLWQLFAYDPSGVMLELTFLASDEHEPQPDVPENRQYRPREHFFDAQLYR